jgi:hypothetical protein
MVVEQQMSAKQWSEIKYQSVPSVAMARSMKAFSRNDTVRFGEYLNRVKKGETKINASVVFPHDIIRSLKSGQTAGADAQWNALPDFVASDENFLPICDVSGSMSVAVSGTVSALDVCLGLGLYLSERGKGAFKDIFMTFSARPTLQKVSGSLSERMNQMNRGAWDMNTDMEAAFNAVLDHGIKYKVPQADMPTTLIVFSDMEFDQCIRNGNDTIYRNMRKRFADAGYNVPKVVFWNLNSRNKQFPVTAKDPNTALVSGFNPILVKNLLGKANITPEQVMLDTVMVERYNLD